MKSTLRLALAIACMAILLPTFDANAGTRTLGPPDHFSQAEKNQYWLGAIGRIAQRYCGYQAEGNKLVNLAKKYEAGRYALARWGAGRYAGSCAQVRDEYIPWINRMFQAELNPLVSDFSNWTDKQICANALNKHEEIPEWSVNPKNSAAVNEASTRGLKPNQCMVLNSLESEQAQALSRNSINKLAEIASLLREELITSQEADEMREEILGNL